MSETGQPRWNRRIARWLSVASGVSWMFMPLIFGSGWLRRNPEIWMSLAATSLVGIVLSIRDGRQRRAEHAQSDSSGRWPLGRPYHVEIDEKCNGTRRGASLVFDEQALRFDGRALARDRVVPFGDVAIVRVRPAWIEFQTASTRFRVTPWRFVDRERLLWELAVRCNAALERGIDEESSAARAAAPPRAAAAASPLPSTPGGSGMGLASALAGPMDPGNPAPPRKSGLGNGLFVVPPPPESEA